MSKLFENVEINEKEYNQFDLSHEVKLSGKMGELIPILVEPTIPGDTFKVTSNLMARFAPLIAPVMHKVKIHVHYFYVPNRILWDGWKEHLTGDKDGNDIRVWPHIAYLGNADRSSLIDYMGLPVSGDEVDTVDGVNVSLLPFNAYQKIYDEYYRDQNLIESDYEMLEDGYQSNDSWQRNTQMRKRAWEHDYFTSSLPFAQKGPEVKLPLGTQADLKSDGGGGARLTYLGSPVANKPLQTNNSAYISDATNILDLNLDETWYADLENVVGATIAEFRKSLALQHFLELNARAGTRYNEYIKVHYGTEVGDARINRPEYIGGFTTPMQISEVLQTSSTDATTPQGNMSGHGVAIGGGKSSGYYCREHGYIMGIMSIRPRSTYQQGIPKHFMKDDKFDHYLNAFAHIGEQPVYGAEIALGSQGDNEWIFGYQSRYAEYKFAMNRVCGDFKASLDFYHLGRKFANVPRLNQEFIECKYEEFNRIFAVQDGTDNVWIHVDNQVKARRNMPVFGNPKII